MITFQWNLLSFQLSFHVLANGGFFFFFTSFQVVSFIKQIFIEYFYELGFVEDKEIRQKSLSWATAYLKTFGGVCCINKSPVFCIWVLCSL